jgi:hypothetical protein
MAASTDDERKRAVCALQAKRIDLPVLVAVSFGASSSTF